MEDSRPSDCRDRLKEQGGLYPKSCIHCSILVCQFKDEQPGEEAPVKLTEVATDLDVSQATRDLELVTKGTITAAYWVEKYGGLLLSRVIFDTMALAKANEGLKTAEGWFREYENLHKAKPDYEKSARNKVRADFCRDVRGGK